MPFDPTDLRSTMERENDWLRVEDETTPKSFRLSPPKTWQYYAAVVLALVLLLAIVTGTGAVLLHKGQKMMDRYVERLYIGE